MESDGAGGSGDQLAAKVAEIDIDAVTERVTSEQSAARPTLFGGEAAGVKKKKTSRGTKGKKYRMTGDQKAAARRQDDHGDRGGGKRVASIASIGSGYSESGLRA